MTSAVAAARLDTDPAQGLFAPWQLWTGPLVHGGWWSLTLAGVAFTIFGGGLERRLGRRWYALILLVLAPIAAAPALVAGLPSPALGLGPLAVGCAGGLLALAPGAPLRIDLWWWAVVVVGRRRYRIGLHWLLAAYVALEAWRLGRLPRTGLDALQPGYLPVFAIGLVLMVVAGHLLGRWLAGIHDHAALAPVARLAAGEGDLDRLEQLLAQVPEPPLAHLVALADRAMQEDRPQAAALVLARLAVVAPESAAARRLRAWLMRTEERRV